MKHDLQAFSRDITALIKTSGDSGDSGDKFNKPLQCNDFSVPTRQEVVSPLRNEWGQPRETSGDRKREHSEYLVRSVPTVSTVPTNFEGRREPQTFEDSPAGWHAILRELELMPTPDCIGVAWWTQMTTDAAAFVARWSGAASDLGWTALNLFGVHPAVPLSRFDVIGLVPLIDGGEVFALTLRTATIRRPSGAVLTHTRKDPSGAVLLCGGHHAVAPRSSRTSRELR